jgi:hypothetical protein
MEEDAWRTRGGRMERVRQAASISAVSAVWRRGSRQAGRRLRGGGGGPRGLGAEGDAHAFLWANLEAEVLGATGVALVALPP